MIYFSDFAAAGGVARKIVTLPIASGTSAPATVSYTSAALSGLTPAGALVIGTIHEVANDPGETAHASLSFGSIVGSGANHITAQSRDATASTTVNRNSSTTTPMRLDTSGTLLNTTAGATVSGGISLTWTTTATNRRSMAMAFAGAGTQAKNGVVALGTGTSAINVIGVGFQPDIVFLYGNNDDFAAGQTGLYQYTFGVATSDGTQRCVVGVELNSQAAGAPFQALLTDCAGGANIASGTTAHKLVVGGFNSDGFTVTPSTSQGSDDIAYLALKFTGQQVKIVSFTTPTSTGSQAITGAGFTPQAAIVVLTNLETIDSVAGATSDLQSGFAVSFIADEHYAMAARIDSGADPTDTAITCRNVALLGASATSTSAITASLTSFDSDGMTLNYSAVQGTGKKGFILFIE